jgi:hypothetical protein
MRRIDDSADQNTLGHGFGKVDNLTDYFRLYLMDRHCKQKGRTL